jgi:putative peptidoglycan lipid II flippase
VQPPSAALSPRRRGAAALVAIGILASRIAGLVRQRVVAHFFGQSTYAADAFFAAFRIPNFLQNLFGEGVLSASMIPEYSRLLAAGRRDDARRLAGAVAGLLGALVLIIVAAGVLAAPVLVGVIVPGFAGERRALAITLVRILFPGVGALVMSAWCLAILNSHRRFLLSYTAPVVWNAAIIVATLLAARRGLPAEALVTWTCWGAVAGSVLQFAVQLPPLLALTGGVPLTLSARDPRVRAVIRNFGPVFLSRGVVQISAFIDAMIASLLPVGAVAVISNTQTLYLLPISLFGMSVAAAELPELSEEAGEADAAGAAAELGKVGSGAEARGARGGAMAIDPARAESLRRRISAGSDRIAYFIVPSGVVFMTLGHLIAGLVLQSGAFSQRDSYWVWATLAGSSVGMLASSQGRLLASTYYALGDTRRPLNFAVVRVALTLVLGFIAALYGPRLFGIDTRWGTAGLTASAGVAGWIEFLLLRRTLARWIGAFGLSAGLLPRLWGAALVAAAVAWGTHALLVHRMTHGLARMGEAALVLSAFTAVYAAATLVLGIGTARSLLQRLTSRRA